MKRVVLLNTTKEPPVRMLSQRGDISLMVVTEPANAELHAPYCDPVLIEDVEDLQSVRSAVLRRCPFDHVDYVVSSSERTLQAGGYLRSLLGIPGVPYDIANKMSNKYAMKRALANAGLRVTSFRLVKQLIDVPDCAADLKWPVVIKPVLGTGAINTFALDSLDDFHSFVQSPDSAALRHSSVPLIVEELIDFAWEFHCDGVVQDHEVLFAAPSRYFAPLLKGMGGPNGSFTIPADSVDRHTIQDLHRRAVAAVGLKAGVTHMEGYFTQGGYLVGEISCRPGGAAVPELVRAQYDLDLWEYLIGSSLNERLCVSPREKEGIFAQCWIPPVAGVVRSMTSQAELEAIPWVASARVVGDIGQAMGSAYHSSSYAAMIIYSAIDADHVMDRMEELTSLFRIRVG